MVGVDPDALSGCIGWGSAEDILLMTGNAVTSWPSRVGPDLDSTAGGVAPTYQANAWGNAGGVRFAAGAVLRRVAAMPGGFAGGLAGCTVLVFARSRQASQSCHLLTVSTAAAAGNARYSARLAATTGTSYIVAAGRRLDADTLQSTSGGGTFQWSVLDSLRSHAVSVIFDHTRTDAIVQQDGVQVHGSTSWLTAGTSTAGGAQALSVGCSPADAANGFTGDIFEWAIFSRALAEGEVGQVAARWMERYGLAPSPVTPAVVPWELDLPALKASDRQTTGCWYSPIPVSRENEAQPDVWARAFVSPDGTATTGQAAMGGLWRDRPKVRAVRPESNWWLLDHVELAQWMQARGIDGVATDVISPTAESARHWTWNRVHAMSGLLTGFAVPFFLDGDGWENLRTAAETADLIQTLESYGAGWKLGDGRTVVYVFAPELCALPGQTPIGTVSSPASESSTMRVFFDAVTVALQARGIEPAWLFCPISGWDNYKDALRPLAWAGSWWGSANPNGSRNATTHGNQAASEGFVWAQPVKPQDVRPRDGIADESGSTENIRTQIGGAIASSASVLNITTVNDWNEATGIEPTEAVPQGYGTILSYWIAWWKLASPPPIVREGVAVIHRKHPRAAVPLDPRNTDLMTWRSGTLPRDDIEVITWVTAPSKLTMTVGGVTSAPIDIPAGYSLRNVPLGVGPVIAAVTRSGVDVVQVTSNHPVVARPQVQDFTRYPTLAVADTPVIAEPEAAEAPIALARVWAGTGRPVVVERIQPDGTRKRVDLSRVN